MEELLNQNAYAEDIVAKIKSKGALAISIANRWMMGWPERVCVLLKSGSYVEVLDSQVSQEREILAHEGDLLHLSRREILKMYEIRESPPSLPG